MKKQSSGAEKAEKLTRKTSGKSAQSTAKTGKKSTPTKSTKTTKSNKSDNISKQKSQKRGKNKPVKATKEQRAARRLEKKNAREHKKLEAAKIKAEKKQKRLEKKLDAKQKKLDRIAAMKERRAQRREERRERRDMLKHETKEARLERRREERAARVEARVAKRQAAVADKRAKREHRLKVRAEKRAAQSEKRHAPGFGGWLAAVIALGVTTLALGTMMTLGWLNMNGMQSDMADAQVGNLYELSSIVDNLDGNLAKARVSNSQAEQVKLLSDIAIQSEMAGTVIERLPLDETMTGNLTSFVNKMGDSAQGMLYQVAAGKPLTESQLASLDYMYETNAQLKTVINELTAASNPDEMTRTLRGKTDSLMFVTFDNIENNTIETPREINDGPFSDSIEKVNPRGLKGLEEISAPEAVELAEKYFASYNPTRVVCTGEVLSRSVDCYNVSISTKDGEMFAQLSKLGGKVVSFNSHKNCKDKNFDVERCIAIAEDFLSDLGFENMKAVWTSENGTVCNLNFVCEVNGIIVYPDMVKVKVCEERGIVTGMEGLAYVLNHGEREIPDAKISRSDAQDKLHAGFEVDGARLCVMPAPNGGETLAYEFTGSYGGNDYYIYVDARTGQEIEVLTVIGTKQGRALM